MRARSKGYADYSGTRLACRFFLALDLLDHTETLNKTTFPLGMNPAQWEKPREKNASRKLLRG
jgi:hypothetical protein